jgi:hypothetical protein
MEIESVSSDTETGFSKIIYLQVNQDSEKNFFFISVNQRDFFF